MRIICIILLSLLLSACTALTATESLFDKAVADYCKAPEAARNILRKRVASILEPNSIQINCNK